MNLAVLINTIYDTRGDQMLTYENCTLCPRKCGVNRTAGETGWCGMPAGIIAGKAMAHFWEEPPVSGSFGSGTVFFSGCTLRCRFCQNAQISLEHNGSALTTGELRRTMENLIDEEGVQNVSLVTATHFLPSILPALEPKLPVPVVYNCGGYESVETLRELEGKIDVYLPDFKYWDPELSKELAGAPDYPDIAKKAIMEMVRQTGPVQYDEDGAMVRGTLIRHLVLPGHIGNSLDIISWVADTFPKGAVLFSLMAQYTPMPGMKEPLDRRITEDEYASVLSWMEICGIEDAFVQDFMAASTEYIPDFDGSGLIGK